MRFALLLLLSALVLRAQSVKLAWDASSDPGVTNYTLYAHTNILTATNLSTAAVKLNVGTNLTATVEHFTVGKWWFAATCRKDLVDSLPSNILVVENPNPPANMRTVVLQYSGTVTGGFYDVGFFRLRLP